MTTSPSLPRLDVQSSENTLAPFPQPIRWHRPLLMLAVAMTVLSVVVLVLAIVDPRMILGQNAWFKPLKFALSIAIYAVSLAWMIGVLPRFQRTANWLGTIAVVALSIEIVIITGAAALGTTSHFNVATSLNTTVWSIMALSIMIAWLVTLIVGIAVALTPLGDPARDLAIRSGVLLGLIGMALAFLMTLPQPNQIQDFQGIAGAHAVGVADGGPGLPFLGWSIEAGDLRVPHFIGMHALQLIPLALVALERLAPRFVAMAAAATRLRLILVLAIMYTATLTLVTVQALAGESVVRPSTLTMIVGTSTAIAAAVAGVAIIVRSRRDS